MNAEQLYTEKENSKKDETNTAAAYAGVRNPLGLLSENIVQQKNVVYKRTYTCRSASSTIKKVDTNVPKSTRYSTSEVETQVKYYRKSENGTENQVDNQIISSVNEVFVNGEEHRINHASIRQQSRYVRGIMRSQEVEQKVTQTVPVVRRSGSLGEKGEIRKPAQKITLVRRLSNRQKRIGIEELNINCMYDADYFEDNYRYMLQTERNFVYRKSYLLKYADHNFRMIVINWLIYAQQILDLNEPTFFVAIRMFDYVLLSTKVPTNKYILVGVVCMWIANKNFDVHFIQVPKLFALCSGKFSRIQILTMEKDILRDLKFVVNFPEPTTFLYYYLQREHLENDLKICYSALFLLEVFTLLIDFSSLTPSLWACIALYLVFVKYDVKTDSFVDFIDNHILDRDIFTRKSQQIEHCVKQLLNYKCVSTEVIAKYSTDARCKVAKNFTSE